MRKGPEYTPFSGVFSSVRPMVSLFSNAWALFAAAVVVAAPFALVGLAAYGAFNLLSLSTVLTVAAVFLAAAWLMYPSNPPKVDMQALRQDPNW